MTNKIHTLPILFLWLANTSLSYFVANNYIDIESNGPVTSIDNIVIINGMMRCGFLKCPKDTFRCTIKQKSYSSDINLEVTVQCISQNGKVLLTKCRNETNPYPDTSVNTFTGGNLYGDLENCLSCSDSSEAVAETGKVLKNVASIVSTELTKIGKYTNNLAHEITSDVGDTLKNVFRQTADLGQNIESNVLDTLRANGI